MATFTPPINPLNAPNYGSNSRPVDIDQGIKPQGVATNTIMPHGVMQGDESAKYAGEAAAAGIKAGAIGEAQYADLFKDVTTGADFLSKAGVQLVKKDIEDKVYQVADRERQAYTDVLEKIKQGVGVKNILDANASADEPDTPKDVADLPDKLDALSSARDSGKISGTYYQSRLLAEAKNLRAQYPGFREEIDQQFAKVTGTNPANAYITSLVTDINRAASSQATDKNRTLTFIQNNMDSIPNAPQVYHDYNAGLITKEDVIAKAYPYQKMKADLNMNNMLFTNSKNTREENQRIAGDGIDKAAGMVVNKTIDTITAKMGLNTTADVDRLTSAEKSGNIPAPQWQQYGQQVATAKAQVITSLTADADAHGYTAAVGGKSALNQRIADAVKPLDTMLDRVYNHDFGGIYNTQKQLTAQNDETKRGLLNDPKIGPYWQQVQAQKDLGGEQNLQKFNLETIKGNFPEDYKAYFDRIQKEFSTQTNMRTSGIPYTFNDTIDNLKKNGVKDGKFNTAVLNEVKKITDPSIPEDVRMNYAQAAFSSGNRGMISRLQADGTDATGKAVSGQTAVFQRFTSPEMTQSMYELGKKNPEVWNNYTTWAKETLSNELMTKEIHDLAKVNTDQMGMGSTVGWDNKNHRFNYQYNAPAGSVNTPTPNDRWIEASVNRMNGNLSNYKNIAKVTGEDPDAFVLKSIADAAGPEVLRNVNGIPYKLMRDMGLARMNFMSNEQ